MSKRNSDPRESDSPVLFAGISESYFRAFRLLWKLEFANRHEFYWDKALILHPVSQLLGVSLETALKGLLICRQGMAPKTHDLEKLVAKLDDGNLCLEIDQNLGDLTPPESYYELNPLKDRSDVVAMYRRHHIHFELLNRVYDRPFASRYPVLGGHALPNPNAIAMIISTIQGNLNTEVREWRGNK